MWRNYVICVLIGLLLVSTGGNVLLARQGLQAQNDADRLRQRLARNGAEQPAADRLLKQATPSQPSPGPCSVTRGRANSSISAIDQALLKQISRRGRPARPRAQARAPPLSGSARFAPNPRPLQRRLSAQRTRVRPKLLQTLGLISSNESVVQILMDVLVEQVIGVTTTTTRSCTSSPIARSSARRKRHLCPRVHAPLWIITLTCDAVTSIRPTTTRRSPIRP